MDAKNKIQNRFGIKILDTELTKSSAGPSKAGKSQCKTCKIIVECQNFTKDFGEPLLNTFERLKRESYWMVLIGTIKPYGLNTNSVDFAPKYQPPLKKMLPFVVPFSKTANLAAKIVKKHYKKLQNDDEFDVFDFDVITAYSMHKNISDYLVHSKLC